MASFVQQQYDKSIEHLAEWRGRYTKNELCDKIVLNTFYRQQSMLNAFPKMLEGFEKRASFQNINDAYTKVYITYSEESKKLATIDFQRLLDTTPNNPALGIKYSDFKAIAQKSKGGNSLTFNDAYEEIATGYIANFISNHQVMLWAALGYTGSTKTAAIAQAMGVGIEDIDKMNLPYAPIHQIAEQHGALAYLRTVDYQKFAKDIGI
ncbi:hypothetical protein [Hymenobacter koreensis]|uniref:Uncharacterized protein n=1 Tax=Hymenobacter koreensis TaxID=1084523 RepID=A0ABP8JPA7_9BACT